jgi:hypothetical protein
VLSNREDVELKLQRITEKARKDPDCKFTGLFHLMNMVFWRGCCEGLRKDAASGIDRCTRETGESVRVKVKVTMRSRVLRDVGITNMPFS